MATIPDKTYFQEYRSISNYKPTSLPKISWSLESTCGSEARARDDEIMTRYCFSIFLCCKKFKHENKIISNTRNQWYESSSKINIFTILHLSFDMMCYFLLMKMIPCETKYYKSQCRIVWSVSLLLQFFTLWRRLK